MLSRFNEPGFCRQLPGSPYSTDDDDKTWRPDYLLTRAVAEALKKDLGQPVLVINVPGGSHGSVMAAKLATAPHDGYTLGISATAAFTYSPHFIKTSYKLEDFDYLTLLGLNQSGIICAPDRPWKTLKDAFVWAKKEGHGLTYMFQGSDDRDVIKRIAAREADLSYAQHGRPFHHFCHHGRTR